MAEIIDVDALQSFTTAELLKLTEYRIAMILRGGQVRSGNGVQLTHADLPTLYAQRDKLKTEVSEDSASADDAGGIVLVQFGEPQ